MIRRSSKSLQRPRGLRKRSCRRQRTPRTIPTLPSSRNRSRTSPPWRTTTTTTTCQNRMTAFSPRRSHRRSKNCLETCRHSRCRLPRRESRPRRSRPRERGNRRRRRRRSRKKKRQRKLSHRRPSQNRTRRRRKRKTRRSAKSHASIRHPNPNRSRYRKTPPVPHRELCRLLVNRARRPARAVRQLCTLPPAGTNQTALKSELRPRLRVVWPP